MKIEVTGSARGAARRAAGFTLIELLVVFALLALIVGLVPSNIVQAMAENDLLAVMVFSCSKAVRVNTPRWWWSRTSRWWHTRAPRSCGFLASWW